MEKFDLKHYAYNSAEESLKKALRAILQEIETMAKVRGTQLLLDPSQVPPYIQEALESLGYSVTEMYSEKVWFSTPYLMFIKVSWYNPKNTDICQKKD